MRAAFALASLALAGCLLTTNTDGPWPCKTDGDCTGGNACRSIANAALACVAPLACVGRQDCDGFGAGWFCASGTCVAPECTQTSDCNGYPCTDFVCGTSCSGNQDCADGNFCVSLRCTKRPCNGTPGECGGVACQSGFCPSQCGPSASCETGLECGTDGVCR